MFHIKFPFTLPSSAPVLISALLGLAASTAMAADATGEAQARYEAERSACLQGRSQQDKETCLREAAAALQGAKKGGLQGEGEDAQQRQANRLARCDRLPERDREECRKRITVGERSGSAASGGVTYTKKTVTVGQPGESASAPPSTAASASASKQ